MANSPAINSGVQEEGWRGVGVVGGKKNAMKRARRDVRMEISSVHSSPLFLALKLLVATCMLMNDKRTLDLINHALLMFLFHREGVYNSI